jgi:uncharacterized protein YndB with AHSA1/START domain
MTPIRQTYTIKAPVARVWKALTDPKDIEAWGGGPVKMSARPGSTFSLWGGDIHGKNITVDPPTKLIQEWYGGDWDKPSIATFRLVSLNATTTKLTLLHVDVPADERKNFADGWRDYYLGPLKEYVEG